MRRLLVAALLSGLAACAATVPPAPVAAVAPAPLAREALVLPASEGRKIALSLWQTPLARPKGVVIFGHGMGSKPDAYLPLIEAIVRHGYHVAAPLAVDSMAHPDRAKFDLRQGFVARIEDMLVTRGFVHQRFAGQRVALAGHSYGALMALIGGGAVTPAGTFQGPPLAALVALSSPGAIQGIVGPDSFKPIALPLLTVTGTADVVPDFAPDWRAHRQAHDTARPGGKLLLTVPGGTHDLIARGSPALRAALTQRLLTFLDAHVAGDAAARAALDRPLDTPLFTEERR